jgi:hypothetical protein
MRVDYLLSHLLFGMTLLTCLVAVAHLLGDKVARSLAPSRPRARAWTRMVVLSAGIAAGLALMAARFGEGDSLRRPESWERERVAPRPVLSGLGLESAGAPRAAAPEPPDDSFTLVPEPTEEVSSRLGVARAALAAFARVKTTMGPASPPECLSWRYALDELHVPTTPAGAAGIADACGSEPGCFLLVCLAEPLRKEDEERLARVVERGGAAMFVGRPREAGAFPAVRRLVAVRAWKTAEAASRPAALVLTGSALAYGGVPPGLRIVLGRDWQEAPGAPIAEGAGEVSLLEGRSLLEIEPRASALVLRSVGAGRAAWTSLPPRLYERLEALYGAGYSLAIAHLFAALAEVPLPGFETLPEGSTGGLVVPALHVEHRGGEAKEIARVFEAAAAPAGYFWVMSEALDHQELFAGLRAAGAEIGASDLDHQGRPDATFHELVARMRDWRRTYEGLPGGTSGRARSGQAGCCELGAWLSSARAPHPASYAALIAAGFDFAVGDPFNDSIAPYRLTVARTASLRESARPAEGPTSGAGALVVLPAFAPDDYGLLGGAALSGNPEEIENVVLRAHEAARTLGGPLVLRVHSQLLGSAKGRPALERALRALRRQGAGFLSPRAFVSFWDRKSRISQRFERESGDVLRLELLNVGEAAFEGGLMRIPETAHWRVEDVPPGWEPIGAAAGDSASRRYRVPRIDPGQRLVLRLARVNRTSAERASPPGAGPRGRRPAGAARAAPP